MTAKSKKVTNKNSKELADSLGFSASDSVEWEIRHSVSKKIIEAVNKNALTVTQLAKDAGTSRARITKILKEDSIGISLDVLFRVLGATGYKVKISYSKAA